MSLHLVMFFTEPLNDVKSYEYVSEKEIDVREKGKDDGDRLVGGEISSTRLSQQFLRRKMLSGYFLSWFYGTRAVSRRLNVVVRF